MANCSDVDGDITLKGKWTKKMITEINEIKGKWNRGEYYTDVFEEFETADEPVPFVAVGRWNYMENLKWMAKDLGTGELLREMEENEAAIFILFKEDEAGTQLLRETEIEISSSNERAMLTTHSEKTYEYTAENLVKLNFYDNIETVSRLINVD